MTPLPPHPRRLPPVASQRGGCLVTMTPLHLPPPPQLHVGSGVDCLATKMQLQRRLRQPPAPQLLSVGAFSGTMVTTSRRPQLLLQLQPPA